MFKVCKCFYDFSLRQKISENVVFTVKKYAIVYVNCFKQFKEKEGKYVYYESANAS